MDGMLLLQTLTYVCLNIISKCHIVQNATCNDNIRHFIRLILKCPTSSIETPKSCLEKPKCPLYNGSRRYMGNIVPLLCFTLRVCHRGQQPRPNSVS
ncbi:hypothetical protein FKM82_030208 [Ascaphus truei]